MKQKLTPSQATGVIFPVEELAPDQQVELDWEEVKGGAELSFPDWLLNQVRVFSERGKALPVARKGQKPSLTIPFGDLLCKMAAIAQVGLLGAMISGMIWINHRKEAIANRIAHPPPSRTRIILSNDYGNYFVVFNRQERPHLYYRVTLQNPPKEQKLSLKLSLNCDWIDPTGQVVHRNLYQTKLIHHRVWTSACSYQLGDKAKLGTWQVKMSLGDRLLTKTEFIVE